jgi:hypothetical protein
MKGSRLPTDYAGNARFPLLFLKREKALLEFPLVIISLREELVIHLFYNKKLVIEGEKSYIHRIIGYKERRFRLALPESSRLPCVPKGIP